MLFKRAMWLPGKSKSILSGFDQTWHWLNNNCNSNILIPFVIVYENSEGIAMTANVDDVYSNSEHKNQTETEQRGYKVSTKYIIWNMASLVGILIILQCHLAFELYIQKLLFVIFKQISILFCRFGIHPLLRGIKISQKPAVYFNFVSGLQNLKHHCKSWPRVLIILAFCWFCFGVIKNIVVHRYFKQIPYFVFSIVLHRLIWSFLTYQFILGRSYAVAFYKEFITDTDDNI